MTACAWVYCGICEGTGKIPDREKGIWVTCVECKGKGGRQFGGKSSYRPLKKRIGRSPKSVGSHAVAE